MRLATYFREGITGVGLIESGRIFPIADNIGAAARRIYSEDLLKEDEGDSFSLDEVRLLPVSPQPSKVICVGLNYIEHVEETGRATPEYPVLFPKFATSLVGADDPILLPPESAQVDYEGELAVIIGAAGRRISEADAMNHVLGFTLANDVTMRDYQYKTHQWLQGKAWDGATPLGPHLATPEEFNWEGAEITTHVNGQRVQASDLSRLMFSVPRLVAMVSVFSRLEVGDVILTGTPGGVGFRRDPQLFLQPGDRVSVAVQGLGVLESTCAAEVLP